MDAKDEENIQSPRAKQVWNACLTSSPTPAYSIPNPVHSMLMAIVRYSSSSFLLEYMGKSMRLKHVWDLPRRRVEPGTQDGVGRKGGRGGGGGVAKVAAAGSIGRRFKRGRRTHVNIGRAGYNSSEIMKRCPPSFPDAGKSHSLHYSRRGSPVSPGQVPSFVLLFWREGGISWAQVGCI